MLPAQHARSTPQQAGSAPGFRATEVHSTGAQQGPSASAQHLGPRAAGHAGHTHTKQCARPAAGRRANECARTRPSCSASLPPLSAARGRGVGEGTRAMPIAKDTSPEGRGSLEIRGKRAADTTASSAMAAGATDTTVVGTTAADSQGMAVTRRSRGGGSGRRLSLPLALRGTQARSLQMSSA